MNSYDLRRELEDRKSRKNLLQSQKTDKEIKIEELATVIENTTKARWVVAEVSRLTQAKLTDYIESMVTMAIRSVYDRPFYFLTKFDISRNKSECQLLIYEGELKPREEMLKESFQPQGEEGGGLLDVISFALRVVLWSLQKPKSRNVILLDEPMKFLGALSIKAGELFRQVSHRLNLQLIVNTHDPDLMVIGDRVWTVTHDGKKSHVKQEGQQEKPTIRSRRIK